MLSVKVTAKGLCLCVSLCVCVSRLYRVTASCGWRSFCARARIRSDQTECTARLPYCIYARYICWHAVLELAMLPWCTVLMEIDRETVYRDMYRHRP